jgi:lysozyme
VNLSEKGKTFIHSLEEGDEPALKTYRCQAGVPTIGWGHTSAAGAPEVAEEMEITREDADVIFDSDIAGVVEGVNKILSDAGVTVTQEQFDALVSFAYNEGVEALEKSTAMRWLAEVKPKYEVAGALCWWNKCKNPETGKTEVNPDLTDRRHREAKLFVTGAYEPL